MSSNLRRRLLIVLGVVAIAAAVYVWPRFASRAPKGLEQPRPALDTRGVDIDGKEFALSDYRGKVVVLDFWGFW
jgi:cytochrome oxidase Cu insertion factor (SCO1/SenC/PrrC family)